MTEEKAKNSFSTGMWKKESKAGNIYIGGSFQTYWANYFRNTQADKSETDPDGFLKLFPKDKESGAEPITINMYTRTSKAGEKYVSGKRHFKFFIFTNKRKVNPRAPDYNLVVYDLDNIPVRTEEVANKPEMPANKVEDPGLIEDPDEPPF